MTKSLLFFNRCFDKKRLKNFILWFFNRYGTQETIQLIEDLKKTGFKYATEAGISIGIDDLKIPRIKSKGIHIAEKRIQTIEINYLKGNVTEIERRQQFVEEWNFVSEKLKNNVIQFFKTTDIFNPIYMIAFSGARGNISQVRQLIGMRGLMVDPQGKILDFPIRSNFREGLNLTEYIISCYGARKGVVDTALRTATSGYLTRRLVDVAQQVIIGQRDCGTNRGISFTKLLDGSKTLLPLQSRLIGRVLLKDVFMSKASTKNKYKIGLKNQEISSRLSLKLSQLQNPIFLRSPLTCNSKSAVCQMCYGWSLAHSTIVSIGEAVGVLAAQSIGEPGTQLTMRTFHTGGVFTGGFIDQICAPFDGIVEYLDIFQGLLVRTLNGQIGFLTKTEGRLQVKRQCLINANSKEKEFHTLSLSAQYQSNLIKKEKVYNFLSKIQRIETQLKTKKTFSTSCLVFNIPIFTTLLIRHCSVVFEKDLIAELSSPSFLENQRQETEQDIFASTSGQIFFEDLVLIEKTTRDGTLQRMTYGLGSIWVISGVVWNKIFDKKSIPLHGDLIGVSSTVQKFQILIERPYHLDLKLSHSIQKFNFFKRNTFSIGHRKPEQKVGALKNFFLKRCFFCLDFQKIYYRDFQYFLFFNPKNVVLNKKNLNFFYFSSYRLEFLRKNHFCLDQNNHKIGLNFHFNQKIFPFYSKNLNIKSNFSLLSIHFLPKKLSRKFLLNSDARNQIQSKLRLPISSRKKHTVFDSNLELKPENLWVDFLEPINFTKKMSFLKSYQWIFYTKTKQNLNEDFELPLQNRVYINSKALSVVRSKSKSLVGWEPDGKKISKVYFNQNKAFYQTNFLYLSKSKFLTLYNKFYWITEFQSFFILLNRQGNLNFYSLSSLGIGLRFRHKNRFIENLLKTKRNIKFSFNFEKRLNWNVESSTMSTLCKLKNNKKPLLLDKKGFCLSAGQSPLVDYITRDFYTLFYKKNLSVFYLKNLKAGFKAQLKINIIPSLNRINGKKKIEKQKKIKPSNVIQKLLLKRAITDFSQPRMGKYNYNKSQKFLSWPYIAKKLNLVSTFGSSLNKGSMGLDGIIFDAHEIIVDFIFFDSSKLIKNNLGTRSEYKHLINVKKRFFTASHSCKKLILFQKIQNNIHQKEFLLKKRLLTQSSSTHKGLIFLVLNSIRYYYNFFKQTPLKPKIFSDHSILLGPMAPIRKRLFHKTSLFSRIQFKTTISFNSYIFGASYNPIYQEAGARFTFKDFGVNSERINKKFDSKYSSFIFNSASKAFYFGLIKKLDFQALDLKKMKKGNSFKIFHSIMDPICFKNLIIIKSFLNLRDGEIISVQSNKEKTTFVALTRADLETLLFDKPLQYGILINFRMGKFIRFGDKFKTGELATGSGQIIYIDKQKLIIRKATSFLITSRSLLNVYQNEVIEKNARLFTFFYHQIKTGDIIQGIPKIEEFFEARATREGMPLLTNLHIQLKQLFNKHNTKFSIFEATQKSFETIQKIIVDEIQKIYCSQGVFIADKHLEIIVRQMTSKVQILEGGQTGLLAGELIEFDWIRLIHQKLTNEEIFYEPIILGITKSCLETESFISAASFQETTRILSKAAIQNKVDFVRGLKQNVILGNLIPAGTGFLPFN